MDTDSYSSGVESDVTPPPLPVPDGKPWGFWATLGLGVLIWLVWMAVQSFSGGIFTLIDLAKAGVDEKNVQEVIKGMEFNGLMIGIASLVSMPFLIGGCWLFSAIRGKHGITVREYLGLKSMGWKSWILWPMVTYAVMFVIGHLLIMMGAPEENPWMKDMAEKVTDFWFLVVAVVFCAPIVEEFLFRGFMFKGWMHSRIGVPGTILATSFLWTIIHIQYDLYGLAAIFSLGILLGTVRYISKSIWAPIWIHFLNNVLATYEMVRMMNESP